MPGANRVAAMDRQHPRDLFDVMQLMAHEGITPGIRYALSTLRVTTGPFVGKSLGNRAKGEPPHTGMRTAKTAWKHSPATGRDGDPPVPLRAICKLSFAPPLSGSQPYVRSTCETGHSSLRAVASTNDRKVIETVSTGRASHRQQPLLHCCPSLANGGSRLWQLSSGSEVERQRRRNVGTCRTSEIKPVT
jgi:hypothetical protein